MNVIFVGSFEEKLNTDIYEKQLKITFTKYPAIHTKTLYPTLPIYNIIIIFDTLLRRKRNIEQEK